MRWAFTSRSEGAAWRLGDGRNVAIGGNVLLPGADASPPGAATWPTRESARALLASAPGPETRTPSVEAQTSPDSPGSSGIQNPSSAASIEVDSRRRRDLSAVETDRPARPRASVQLPTGASNRSASAINAITTSVNAASGSRPSTDGSGYAGPTPRLAAAECQARARAQYIKRAHPSRLRARPHVIRSASSRHQTQVRATNAPVRSRSVSRTAVFASLPRESARPASSSPMVTPRAARARVATSDTLRGRAVRPAPRNTANTALPRRVERPRGRDGWRETADFALVAIGEIPGRGTSRSIPPVAMNCQQEQSTRGGAMQKERAWRWRSRLALRRRGVSDPHHVCYAPILGTA